MIEPRKLWASGLPGRKGKITGLAPGRALAFADDPAWSDVLARCGSATQPAPPEVLAGLVEVLRRWSRVVGAARRGRADAVAAVPGLVRSLAEHWPRSAGCRWSTPWRSPDRRPTADAASAVRAKDLLYRTRLAPASRFDGPVLLVDDTVRSRWTITVAGSLFGRRRGHLGPAAGGPSPPLTFP